MFDDDLDDIFPAGEEDEYEDEGDFFSPDDSEVRGAEAYLDAERGVATAEALEQEGGKGQAFDLVKEALAGGLGPSQEMYEILGNLLSQKRANRQQRVIIRKARRILEQSFGLDAVRKTVAPASSSYTRIPTPAMEQRSEGGFVGPALVVHRFDRKQRRIRGGGTRQYFAPGTTYTGYDAVTRAVDEHRQTLQNRLKDLIARRDKLGPGVSSERRRRLLNVNIEAVQEELAKYAPQERQRPVRPRGMRAPESPEEVAQMMLSAGASMGPIKTYLTSTGRNRGEIRAALRDIYGGVDAYDRAASDYILNLEKQIEALKKSSSSERDVIEARIRLLKKEVESTRGTISGKFGLPKPSAAPPVETVKESTSQFTPDQIAAAVAADAEARKRDEQRAAAKKIDSVSKQRPEKPSRSASSTASVPVGDLKRGRLVRHPRYGKGIIVQVKEGRVTINFSGKRRRFPVELFGVKFFKA